MSQYPSLSQHSGFVELSTDVTSCQNWAFVVVVIGGILNVALLLCDILGRWNALKSDDTSILSLKSFSEYWREEKSTSLRIRMSLSPAPVYKSKNDTGQRIRLLFLLTDASFDVPGSTQSMSRKLLKLVEVVVSSPSS